MKDLGTPETRARLRAWLEDDSAAIREARREVVRMAHKKALADAQALGSPSSKDAGTKQTRARLVSHPIWVLHKRRFLLDEHFDAAWQIEGAFKSLTSPASLRMMRFEGEGYELRTPSFVAHLSDMQARQIKDYNDWVDELTRQTMDGAYAAIVDCLTEAITLRQIERGRRWRNGEAKRKIRDGLQVYCEVVGTL